MNILFVHEVDWLRKVVFEIHSLSELLSLSGHRVYAIDYESMWVKNKPFDFGNLKTETLDNVARAYPGASVSLIRPGFIKIRGLSRLTAAFTHYREIRNTIKEKKIDVIILYSVPTNGLQTLSLAKKFGVPVVFRAIDILNQLVRYPVLRPITRMMENRVYSNADLILTISPRLSEYIIKMGAPEARVKLVPLGIDTGMFRPDLDCTEIGRQWQLGEKSRVIVFIGTLFDFSGLDNFIRRFPDTIKEVPEAKLLIVGDGPQRPKLERIIAELKLEERVIITGFQPFETMPRYINLATVCIITFPVTDTTRDIFPTKVLQYMACGKATLAMPLPGMMALAPGEPQGIVYADTPTDMASEIVALLKDSKRRQRLGEAALSYVQEAHGDDRIAQQFEAVLNEIVASGKAA